MPRLSAEARSAAAWRAGEALPPAPAHLGDVARGIWAEVVASHSAGYFDAASLCLLESFCFASAELRRMWMRLQELEPKDPRYDRMVRAISTMCGTLSTMATRLRLCHSSRLRKEDGILDERAPRRNRLLGCRENN